MRAAITRGELFAFVRTLGGNPYDTHSIEIDHTAVTVTTFLRDEQGHLVAAGDVPATETARIAIVGDDKAATVRMRHPNLDREVDVPATAVGHHAVAGWEVVTDEPAEVEQDKQPEAPAPDDEEPKTPRGRRKTSKESD